jgi:hypothetical protein
MSARGVLYVHSCPPALTPHVEWAVAAGVGGRVSLSWSDQPAAPGTLRAEVAWRSRPGTAGRLAAALRGWSLLRFEVTEDSNPGVDGERYSYTPTLGLFRTTVSANGDVMVGEDRLRVLLASVRGGEALTAGLDSLLGTAWDNELERFRHAGDGAPVSRLHEVG